MSGDPNTQTDVFTPIETDTIGEIMNISMGSAATAASTLLDNKVNITTPVVNVVTYEQFEIEQLEPAIAVEIQYVEGIAGSNILILKRSDVRAILSRMMMMELPEDFQVDEMAESAICELMNQMMGSSATVLSCFLGRVINISTPRVVPIDELEHFKENYFAGEDYVVSIAFTLTIQDSIESVFVSAMRVGLAKEIINVSLNFDTGEGLDEADAATPPPAPEPPAAEPAMPPAPTAAAPASPPPVPAPPPVQPMPEAAPPVAAAPAAPPPPPVAAAAPQPAPPPPPMTEVAAPAASYPPQQPYPQQAPYPAAPPYGYYPPSPAAYGPPPGYEHQPVKVQDYTYGDFTSGAPALGPDAPTNLDLVMNVPVVMTVELGRTKRKIKEILEFGQGTIVELDKQAGSHVDVIVNGQLIARGDVVVVDDNFSIRITEIIKQQDPLSMMS